MTELVTALLWVLFGILLGGLVVFAWVADMRRPHSKRDPKTGRYVK